MHNEILYSSTSACEERRTLHAGRTNGQHAFYQLLHQGTTVVPVESIGFRHNQYQKDIVIKETTSQDKLLANLLAQSLAMATGRDHENPNKRFAGNRPNSILLADCLTPMGALLAIYETKIAMQGFVWNINSFDQEGVQLGKVLAGEILEHIARYRKDENYRGADDDLGWAMVGAAGLRVKKWTSWRCSSEENQS
jgi:glucose-6-phosphate isomerase